MKLKFAIFTILVSTACAIGLIYTLMNHTDVASKNNEIKEVKSETATNIDNTEHKEQNTVSPKKEEKNNSLNNDDNDPNNINAMSDQDIKYIEKISSINSEDLSKELESLKQHIEKSDLVTQLENKKLDKRQAEEAKSTLERFAILGLEATRRKYVSIEPELKDAVMAHRDSLREIREMLSEY